MHSGNDCGILNILLNASPLQNKDIIKYPYIYMKSEKHSFNFIVIITHEDIWSAQNKIHPKN